MTVVILVLLAALAFEYINGFHDAANAIATVVSTRVLTPRQAIALAACFNLVGAFLGVSVAKTIASGLVDTSVIAHSQTTVLASLLAAIIWNLLTWWLGLPSSSSHALIGGLCGAALATSSSSSSGRAPTVIASTLRSPSRTTSSSALSPALRAPTRWGKSADITIGWPFRLRITSPTCRPPLAAGPSSSTWATRAPAGLSRPKDSARSLLTSWITTPNQPRLTLPPALS